MEATWENQLAEARKLSTEDLARHASVSTGNRHRCRDCFCCAALEVLNGRVTIENVKRVARELDIEMQVHGDTPSGEIDVEFETVLDACEFARYVRGPFHNWTLDIRTNDTLWSLYSVVTLTIKPA